MSPYLHPCQKSILIRHAPKSTIYTRLRNLNSPPPHRYICGTTPRHQPTSQQETNNHDLLSRPGSLAPRPSPPRLPKDEQDLFEELQQRSTGAFSSPRVPDSRQLLRRVNQSSDITSSAEKEQVLGNVSPTRTKTKTEDAAASTPIPTENKKLERESPLKLAIEARGRGEELHPNVRRGAKPEFEGHRNPRTGEVGGPKNEPLRWGSEGEWSYNGRTTDF